MFHGAAGHICPRCNKRVYFAEEIIAIGSHWHKSCFSCASCKKRLDSRTCTERNDELYCTHCYAKLFGPKGYGFGQGAGTLSMDNGTLNEPVTSNISAFAQAQVAPLFLNNNGGATGGSTGTGSRTSTPSSSSPHSPPLASGLRHSNGGMPQNGSAGHTIKVPVYGTVGLDLCRRCGKPAYLAERVLGAGSIWHKMTCFTCQECNKRLESTTLCDKDGDIFCKTCYGRKFGPKGYGYGIGAGTLQMQQ